MNIGRPPTQAIRGRWRAMVGAAALAVIAASCGASDATTEAAGPSGQGAAAETTLVAATASGGQLDFGALEGTDYVLWFWAPW